MERTPAFSRRLTAAAPVGSTHFAAPTEVIERRAKSDIGQADPKARHSGRPTLAAFFVAAAIIAPPLASPQAAVLIQDALLIDGTGRQPRARTDILLRKGRISRIGATGSFKVPAGTDIADASGKTVIPGIVNLRGLAGLIRSPEVEREDFSREEILRHLGRYASYGVTTVATLAPRAGRLKDIQDDIDSGRLRYAARVLTPLRILRATTPTTERYPRLGQALETPRNSADARRAVDRLAEEGADFIAFRDVSNSVRKGIEMEVPSAIIKRARQLGLPVAIQTSSVGSAAALVRAGARVVASSVCDREVGDGVISEMLAANAVYAPALFGESIGFEYGDRVGWLDDRYLRRSLPPGIVGLLRGPVLVRQALDPDRALKRHRFDIASRNLRKLATAGVRIGFASGSGFPGSFEGYSEYREAVLMKRAGLAPLEIVRAFSSGSATALGIERQRGALLPGRLADLVILNADPLDNIHNLRELHAVFVGGRLVKL